MPAMAAARAAVKDSTSSKEEVEAPIQIRFDELGGRLYPTYQNHNKAVPLLNHLHNAPEQPLNELPGLREPFGEERMSIDLE